MITTIIIYAVMVSLIIESPIGSAFKSITNQLKTTPSWLGILIYLVSSPSVLGFGISYLVSQDLLLSSLIAITAHLITYIFKITKI